jgi:DNA-binding NtrC family response regulator
MRILLVEDELELRETLADLLVDEGHTVLQAGDGAHAFAAIQDEDVDLVISDVHLPDAAGSDVLRVARQVTPRPDFILMTAFADVTEAVSALKLGASDYLVKPFEVDELLHHVRRIASGRDLRRQLVDARLQRARALKSRLVGTSPQMRKVIERIEALGPSDANVLIMGESGTGKELAAREIHDRSPRAERPLVAVNCAAFPATLIEAELFGYERGAFTGADRAREGRFRAADGGTLFLDEIGELPLAAQAKLLRVLQEGRFEPLGSDTPIRVDVRIISATHRNLRQLASEGTFREDLFYRINVLDLSLPALREREADRELLMRFFLGELARKKTGQPRPILPISREASAALMSYPFPGNVRELAHAIEHAAVLSGGKEIKLEHLPDIIAAARPDEVAPPGEPAEPAQVGPVEKLSVARQEFEILHLRRALAVTGGKRVKAAQLLGISRKSLWEKLARAS